jgi:hypothetical protein
MFGEVEDLNSGGCSFRLIWFNVRGAAGALPMAIVNITLVVVVNVIICTVTHRPIERIFIDAIRGSNIQLYIETASLPRTGGLFQF